MQVTIFSYLILTLLEMETVLHSLLQILDSDTWIQDTLIFKEDKATSEIVLQLSGFVKIPN